MPAPTHGARHTRPRRSFKSSESVKFLMISHDGECTKVHEQIRHQVKKHRPGTVGRQRRQAHHHVARMGDGRIGEQALEVGLAICRQVAEGGRDRSEEGNGRHQILGDSEKSWIADRACQHEHKACQEGQRRPLGGHRQKPGNFGRGPFKHVRAPEMKRHRRQLEGDADQEEQTCPRGSWSRAARAPCRAPHRADSQCRIVPRSD